PSPAQSGASIARAHQNGASAMRQGERVADAERRPGEGDWAGAADRPLTPTRSPDGGEGVINWLARQPGIGEGAARQIVDYLAAAQAALGVLPTQDTLVFERFFDEAGGMQLVIH